MTGAEPLTLENPLESAVYEELTCATSTPSVIVVDESELEEEDESELEDEDESELEEEDESELEEEDESELEEEDESELVEVGDKISEN